MKSTIVSTTAVLALASSGLAQFSQQSKPFQLILKSADKSINGKILGACHEGAAIEGLCTLGAGKPTAYNTFQFNTSSNAIVSDKKLGPTGLLTYELQADKVNESEPMQFFYDPSTNVALPLFEPSVTGQQVGFDSTNRMHVQSYLDDTVNPPTDTQVHAYYRWYVCKTNFEGYVYQTLAWVMGNGKPENPSCEKVDVIRKFE